MRAGFHSAFRSGFRRAMGTSSLARATGAPLDEAAAAVRQARIDRRTFLAGATAAGILAAAPSTRPESAGAAARSGSHPRVVIVGAGLAGLRCAHALWVGRGIPSTVYEWDDHAGGRVLTFRDVFAHGQIIEEHGEFISSEHRSMLRLARRFGLEIENTDAGPAGAEDTFWVGGHRYTQDQLDADWHAFGWAFFRKLVSGNGITAGHRHPSPEAVLIDRLSVSEFLAGQLPGGASSDFARLCALDVTSEYGGSPDEQSALNLVGILGWDASAASGYQHKGSPLLAGTDEKWHVRGGNDQIIRGLLDELPAGTLQTGHRLVALRNDGASATSTFDTGGALVDVPADHVVLTLPFTKLREVDLAEARLSPLKRTAIASLQLGTNAKVALQVAGDPWGAGGYTGNMFADNGAVGGWSITGYQPGPTSIFLDYLGGDAGASLASRYGLTEDHGTPPPQLVADQLAALEPVFPGLTASWEAGPGIAWYADGTVDEHLGGSYSYYRVGQATGFGGIEGTPEGTLHFAGEHTSQAYQGFMEGAVTSGERAAREIPS
jgi:monoamine oxidase